MAGSAGSPPAFSTRWRRCSFRRWGTGCATNTASSSRRSQDGWQREQPDNWLRHPDPWEVPRPQETVEIKLGCSFEVQGGSLRPISGRPSSLLGMPFDRPVVGYGGKTINTLRLWAAATPDGFDFQVFSAGDFVGALAETARRRVGDPRSLSRRLDEHGSGAALRAGIFSRRLLAGRPGAALPPRAMPIGARCPTRWRSSSTIPTPRSRFRS